MNHKPIYEKDMVSIKRYLEDISEYVNPDGGGGYPALTELKKITTRINNRYICQSTKIIL